MRQNLTPLIRLTFSSRQLISFCLLAARSQQSRAEHERKHTHHHFCTAKLIDY